MKLFYRHLGLAFATLAAMAVAGPIGAQEPQKKAVESPTDPAPRPGNWMKMHETLLERTKQGNVDLYFLGDSITQGWGGSGKTVWAERYAPRKAGNFGIGGDRTQHVLWRLDHGEIEGLSPKVVVLMIGTNNLGANGPDEIAEGIEAIVKNLNKKVPTAKILLLGIFPRGERPTPVRDKIRSINDRIAKLDNGKSVRYLDISEKFLGEGGTISREIMPDFLHLSESGYRIWADAIEATLTEMLGSS